MKHILFMVSVIIDVVADDAIPFPKKSRRFPAFYNNDSTALKRENMYDEIFSPSQPKI